MRLIAVAILIAAALVTAGVLYTSSRPTKVAIERATPQPTCAFSWCGFGR